MTETLYKSDHDNEKKLKLRNREGAETQKSAHVKDKK